MQPRRGHIHPISSLIREANKIFFDMGFTFVAAGSDLGIVSQGAQKRAADLREHLGAMPFERPAPVPYGIDPGCLRDESA